MRAEHLADHIDGRARFPFDSHVILTPWEAKQVAADLRSLVKLRRKIATGQPVKVKPEWLPLRKRQKTPNNE